MPGELPAGIAFGVSNGTENMDVIFAIGTADSRELEFEHGA
jgi:hypothetical protein